MRYALIREMDISNGEGVGVSLFVQGCPFHCHGCFNSDTWDFNGGKEWTEDIKLKFFELINKPYIQRVTILGGEPLADENVDSVCELITEIKTLFPDKKIWLYTGYDCSEILYKANIYYYTPSTENAHVWLTRRKILTSTDVLIDGMYIHELQDMNLKWRGSSNQRVINVKQTLKQGEIVTIQN